MMVFLCEACRAGETPIYDDCCKTSAAQARETAVPYAYLDETPDDGHEVLDRCDDHAAELRLISKADEGDLAAIIQLWHLGFPLCCNQQAILDAALLGNRVDIISRSYEDLGRAA
jgi:hypothetical protein